MAKANPIQREKYLCGINYPVSKADLIKYARQQGADESVRAPWHWMKPSKTITKYLYCGLENTSR